MKHLLFAILGVVLNGAGLSCFGEAVIRKGAAHSQWQDWFWMGTFSLILINAGLCLVVEAGLSKLRRDIKRDAGAL